MIVPVEHESRQSDDDSIYTRSDAERILSSSDRRPVVFDSHSLPIAGPRSIFKDGGGSLGDLPKEILSIEYRPIIVFDLDEIVWPHIKEVVRAVGEATGKKITMDYYRTIGNTRKVPEWKNDQSIMDIHDQIIRGEHPDYYPYVNVAYPDAIKGLHAVERMGHGFFYQTSRPSNILGATLRIMDWNTLPRNCEQNACIDPFVDIEQRNGTVYCGDGLPMLVDRTREPKREVLEHWLHNLREKGWKGEMVVIDDLQKPFEELLAEGKIMGVALQGDVNASRDPLPGEVRVNSWQEISTILMNVHRRAVSSDPSQNRVFECHGRSLFVDKKYAGTGEFDLSDLPTDAWRWAENPKRPDVQKDFEKIGHEWGNATGL